MDLETVTDELYGLRPDQFTAARDQRAAQARESGDRPLAERIKALRRPSLAAWASNLLVREQPDEVEPLVQLGEGLRQAHRGLDGERLRELSRQQHALIHALARQAGQLADEAGHPVGEGARREIEETLHAVLADERAARAWASGRLTKALSATTGFDVVAVAADAAAPRRAPAPRAPAKSPHSERDARARERRRQKLAEARQDAEDAERRLRDREKEAAAADRDAERAAKLTEDLRRRLEELARERESTEERHRHARAEERAARDRARAAEHAVREAAGRAGTAAALVERLTGGTRDHRGTEGGDG